MNKILKTNYHTHSTFCDGNSTPEQFVEEAIKREFDIIGFSSHAMHPFSDSWHLLTKNYVEYITELSRLKTKYEGKIKIYSGFEADYIRGITKPSFKNYAEFNPDYLIGAVHYVLNDKGLFEADGNPKDVITAIRNNYNGNERKAVSEYFAAERAMLHDSDFTFIAHPDLIRIQNSKRTLFFESDCWYKKEIKTLAKAIAKSGVCVEVNTGGMARGYLDSPYPSLEFLEILHALNVPVTINSDAHKPENIDYWFTEAIEYIKKAGYTEMMFYTDGSLKTQKI